VKRSSMQTKDLSEWLQDRQATQGVPRTVTSSTVDCMGPLWAAMCPPFRLTQPGVMVEKGSWCIEWDRRHDPYLARRLGVERSRHTLFWIC
jgi:hypothetical protein